MAARWSGWAAIGILSCTLAGCGGAFSPSSGTNTPQVKSAPSTVVPANYFGMHIHHATAGTPWPVVPFGTWRLWDARVAWMDLEPGRGRWDFSKLDALVALAGQHHVDVIMPLALTPQWASARPNEACPYGGGGCAAEPASMQDWTNYVDTVVTRYKGQIGYYEIWNEVNTKAFWTGTPAQIVALEQAAYTEIKRIDPAAKVISPSITTNIGLSYLQSLLDLGVANSADIISYHLYVTPGKPEDIAPLAASVAALLKQYGVDKPLWNTETGWLAPSTFGSDDQAAAFVVRALLIARSAGVERFLWYAWDNHGVVTIPMTEADSATPTRAALAFANLQKWLVGNTLTACSADANDVWSCNLQFAGGEQGRILWHPGSTVPVSLDLSWMPTVVEDMYGNDSAPEGTSYAVGEDPILIKN